MGQLTQFLLVSHEQEEHEEGSKEGQECEREKKGRMVEKNKRHFNYRTLLITKCCVNLAWVLNEQPKC